MCAIIIATGQRNSTKKEYMCMYIPLVVLCLSSYWIGCCRKYNCTREKLIRNILLQMMDAMSYPQLAEAEETLRWSYRNPFSQQTSEALKAFFFYRCSAHCRCSVKPATKCRYTPLLAEEFLWQRSIATYPDHVHYNDITQSTINNKIYGLPSGEGDIAQW